MLLSSFTLLFTINPVATVGVFGTGLILGKIVGTLWGKHVGFNEGYNTRDNEIKHFKMKEMA